MVFPLFVLSKCDFCIPAWRFCTTWMASCKGPIALDTGAVLYRIAQWDCFKPTNLGPVSRAKPWYLIKWDSGPPKHSHSAIGHNTESGLSSTSKGSLYEPSHSVHLIIFVLQKKKSVNRKPFLAWTIFFTYQSFLRIFCHVTNSFVPWQLSFVGSSYFANMTN